MPRAAQTGGKWKNSSTMLYVLYGTDTKKGRDKLHVLVGRLSAKRSDAALLHVDGETCTASALDELIHGQGLFSPKSIVVLDRVFRVEEIKEVVCERLSDIQASENIFVLFEDAVDKKTLTKLSRHAEKIQEFEEAAKAKERFNVFSLTDALGRRDKRALWVCYQKAKQEGIPDEELHGILFWQVKAMLLSARAGNANEAKLNPFVYKKSQGFLRNFSEGELAKLSAELVTLYHDARRGKHELGMALERLILAV